MLLVSLLLLLLIVFILLCSALHSESFAAFEVSFAAFVFTATAQKFCGKGFVQQHLSEGLNFILLTFFSSPIIIIISGQHLRKEKSCFWFDSWSGEIFKITSQRFHFNFKFSTCK